MGVQGVKPMTEGGILAAISVVMALTMIYVPLIGAAVAFVWPLPIIVLVVRHGLRWGILASVVSAVMIALLVHPLQALSMTIAFGLVGLVIGYNYRCGRGATASLLIAIGASVLSKVAVLAFSAAALGINPLHLQLDMMDEAFGTTLEIYRGAGMNEAELAKVAADFKTGMESVRLLLPMVVVFAGMLDAFVNFVISGRVLRRLGRAEVVSLRPFQQWRMPLWVVYLYAFTLIGMYWGPQLDSAALYQTSLNANILANVLGFVQGLAVLSLAADQYRMSRLVRILLLVLVLTNGFFLQAVALTGLFDIIFDIRGRMAKRI